MNYHTLGVVALTILESAAAFILFWYLLGMGIGIAQRGYNRVAPYRIKTRVSQPTVFQRPPRTWDEP
jgi:hypothetical protein